MNEHKTPDLTDELHLSQPFEEALSSTIQKKKNIVKEQEPLKAEVKEEKPTKKTLNLRCPQCKHIYNVEKEEDITKIKCPECGKEGFIK